MCTCTYKHNNLVYIIFIYNIYTCISYIFENLVFIILLLSLLSLATIDVNYTETSNTLYNSTTIKYSLKFPVKLIHGQSNSLNVPMVKIAHINKHSESIA